MSVTIGIDATNLRGGGGVTHLLEILRAAQPAQRDVGRVVVWGGSQTLDSLESRPWLDKRTPPAMERGLLWRVQWQRYRLSQAARTEGCDVLFVPGGSYAGDFHPVVTMSQNLLPFDMAELARYGWTPFALKLMLLRMAQSRSFKRADGVVFLTEHARDMVLRVTGPLVASNRVILHGVSPRFRQPFKVQRALSECNETHPFRLLYVSTVDHYKHQWHVVEAVAALRRQGLAVALDMVGPAYAPALRRLQAALDREDPERRWARYHATMPYEALHAMYMTADMGVCASTCETFGLMLIESMAAGLPIACSNKQPMAGLVGEAGIYFDSENPMDIARALSEAMASQALRAKMAHEGLRRAQQYSWQECADKTFAFLVEIAQREKGIR